VDSLFMKDKLLSLVKKEIPSKWEIIADSSSISFIFHDSTWMVKGKPKAGSDTSLVMYARMKGILIFPEIRLRYEPKWDIDKITRTMNRNTQIYSDLEKLKQKYDLRPLIDTTQKIKGKTVYVPHNEKEKKTLTAYEKESAEIAKGLRAMPAFTSEKYSLFLVSTTPDRNYFGGIIPFETGREFLKIMDAFRVFCGK
jgi:hypothetical protein